MSSNLISVHEYTIPYLTSCAKRHDALVTKNAIKIGMSKGKYTFDQIESILGEYGDDYIVSWYAKYYPERIAKFEKQMSKNKDFKAKIAFVQYGSKKYKDEIGKQVLESGSLVDKYNYARLTQDEKVAKDLQEEIFARGDTMLMVSFAAAIKCADVARIQEYVLAHGTDQQKLDFLFEVDRADKKLVRKVLNKDFLIESLLARYQRVDNSRLYNTLLALEEPKFVEQYFAENENKSIKEMIPYAKNKAQKEFLASVMQPQRGE